VELGDDGIVVDEVGQGELLRRVKDHAPVGRLDDVPHLADGAPPRHALSAQCAERPIELLLAEGDVGLAGLVLDFVPHDEQQHGGLSGEWVH
jgi:hypothetical protein